MSGSSSHWQTMTDDPYKKPVVVSRERFLAAAEVMHDNFFYHQEEPYASASARVAAYDILSAAGFKVEGVDD